MIFSIARLLYVAAFLATASAATFKPVAYALGQTPVLNGTLPYQTGQSLVLSPANPVLTLDYGTEAGGFPYIEVQGFQGDLQFELKYSEQWNGLNQPNGDGPFTFAVALANTYRTETFNVQAPGPIESFFLQGGLRWQSISLLTNGSITLSDVGIRATVPTLTLDQMPGHVRSSNELYTKIWGLGARTVQSLCLETGSQPSTWQLTDEGVLIRGQQTAQSALGHEFANYTLEFSTKILRGGTGWRVASTPAPYGPLFVITSECPANNSFVNTNRTLMPPNSMVFGYGYGFINQSTLTTGPVISYPMPFPVRENVWYTIQTTIAPDGFKVSVNNVPVVTIPYDEAIAWQTTTQDIYNGTWGFGPFLDQAAIVTNVTGTASNGTQLYYNDMKSPDLLAEYGVHSNFYSFCSDGAKRDRLMWFGDDFSHAVRTIAASTGRLDFVTGTMDAAFAWQAESGPNKGLMATDAEMGQGVQFKNEFLDDVYVLEDWEIFFLVIVGEYYQVSGDLGIMQKYLEQFKVFVEALIANLDPHTGLMAGSGRYFFPSANGSVPSALMVIGLKQAVRIASDLGEVDVAEGWNRTAFSIGQAINELLWSEEIGTWAVNVDTPQNYSLMSMALPIRAGLANITQAGSTISLLDTLRLGPGYKDSNSVPDSPITQLSPNTNGFLLEALLIANLTFSIPCLDTAQDLLESLWSPMINQEEYYTGTTWEYLFPDGSPGIDFYTAHSHEWGTTPTYLMTQYFLGISAEVPGFKEWVIRPGVKGLRMESCAALIPTTFGVIRAEWEVVMGGKAGAAGIRVWAQGPEGTGGTVVWPEGVMRCFSGVPQREVECEGVRTDGNGVIDVVGMF
jgi:hypothetical protein